MIKKWCATAFDEQFNVELYRNCWTKKQKLTVNTHTRAIKKARAGESVPVVELGSCGAELVFKRFGKVELIVDGALVEQSK